MDEPPVMPPVRYCTRCREPIDPKRVMRGATFCDNPEKRCRREDAKERRGYRARKACRLCGRPPRRKATQKAPDTLCHASTQPERASQQ